MNNLYYAFILSVGVLFSGCKKEDVITRIDTTPTQSLPATSENPGLQQLLAYNIEVTYKERSYKEPYLNDNQVPNPERIQAVVDALTSLWIMPFEHATDTTFMKKYAPREIRMFGRPNRNQVNRGEIATSLGEAILPIYNVDNFMVAGDGKNEAVFELLRMTLFAFAKRLLYFHPADLDRMAAFNFSPYFNWSVDADAVSEGNYGFRGNPFSLKRGFLTNGAMGSVIDDFAETFSSIICLTPTELNEQLEVARDYGSAQSAEVLQQKIRFVDEYLLSTFKIRREVQLTRAIANSIKKYTQSQSSETTNESDPE